jgi:diadenosine tetraphosphate (Ap4A) HIT family hydrolase
MIYKESCVHCDLNSAALAHPLADSENFRIVCDGYPIVEGHILVIPKEHLSCTGAFSKELFIELEEQYIKVIDFLSREYGLFAVFEHGVVGQTVFHAHMHFMPFKGALSDIVDAETAKPLKELRQIRDLYKNTGKYLFLQINDKLNSVDTKLACPRFFRDLFATYFGNAERGDWKKAFGNKQIVEMMNVDINKLKEKWRECGTK